jgi:uncharacterized protein (UPF0335 family)
VANRNPLMLVVDEIEALEREKAEITLQIAERKTAAVKQGFSRKILNKVLKRRTLSEEQRDEEDALTQIYEGALGMLGGTPLGEAALRRLSEERKRGPEGDDEDAELPFEGEGEPPAPAEPIEGHADDSEDEARAKGAQAAQAGLPVLSNPYAPRTKQRGWWDEAWCQASGSDGMDIPAAWRPTPKPKKPKPGDDTQEGGDA